MTSQYYTNDNIPCLSPIFVQAVEKAINIKIKGSTYNLLARKYFLLPENWHAGTINVQFSLGTMGSPLLGRVCHWTRCTGTWHPAPSKGDRVQTIPTVTAVLVAQCRAPESACLWVSQQLLTHSHKWAADWSEPGKCLTTSSKEKSKLLPSHPGEVAECWAGEGGAGASHSRVFPP